LYITAQNKGRARSHTHGCVGAFTSSIHWGARYYVTFIDDFSKKVWIYFLKQKSKVFQKFKERKTMVKNQIGRKVKVLRPDNGGKYSSKEFKTT